MKQRMRKINLILSAFAMLLLIAPQFALGSSSVEPPTVTKSVSPQDINIAGSGVGEETTVTIEVTGSGGTSTTITPMDVVFALDSSGSMGWNDPSDLRISASKSFVDKMDDSRDQAGVVSWDNNIDFTWPLSSDFTTVKSKIDLVDSSGGTNLNVGLNAAIGVLDAGKDPNAAWVIIFLSNGAGTYTPAASGGPAAVAAAKNYVIYSIGLGDSPATAALTDMATATGGKYYASPTADNLQAIFDDIYEEIVISTIPYNVAVSEVTRSYIIEEGSFNIAPDSVDTDIVTGETTIVWNDIGLINDGDPDLSADETVTLTFTAKSNQVGTNLPVEALDAEVCYDDSDGNYVGCVEIPQGYINVNPMPVDIDIKPGSYPNCFNNDGNGVIPVAILGTENFDVTQVNPGTCSLEGLGVKVAGKSNKLMAHIEDVNNDGYNDLVLQIEDVENVFQEGDATLTGNLYEEYGGIPIEGTDSICLVP